MKRMEEFNEMGPEEFIDQFDPDINVNDMADIHEAYQHLSEEFVEKGGQTSTEGCFLSIEQIKANHERRGSKSSNNSSTNNSRHATWPISIVQLRPYLF